MEFLENLSQKMKNSYYFFEDKWYGVLDKIDSKIPVYKVIDKVDNVIPSFILFLLIVLFLIILMGYLVQFTGKYDVIFTTYDSATNNTISGVNLEGIINDELFVGNTNTSGIYKTTALGQNKNIYAVISEMLFGPGQLETFGFVSATKTGYSSLNKVLLEQGSTQNLFLEPSAGDPISFAGSTKVVLVNSQTNQVIIDSTNQSYVQFVCNNREISTKTVYDGTDGALDGEFQLIEPNCEFKITAAFAPEFERQNTSIVLPQNIQKHQIRLNKSNIVTKGNAKIWVYDEDENPLSNIKVMLNDIVIYTNSSGTATKTDLEPGTYVITTSDVNYYPITPDQNIKIVVTASSDFVEEEIVLRRIPANLQRKVFLKIIDFDTKEAIPNAQVSLVYLSNDGNNSQSAITSSKTISTVSGTIYTDQNGLITQTGLSTLESDKVIAIINKDEYLISFFKPTLFSLSEGPQIIEIKKADNTNSGNATVLVTNKENAPLFNAKTFVLAKIIQNGITIKNIPLPSSNGIGSNTSGNAIFTRLPSGIDYSYNAAAIFSEVYGEDSNYKILDANKTINFHVKIDLEVSRIRLNLFNALTRLPINLATINVNLYSANNDFSTTTFLEKLNLSSGTYLSKYYENQKNYYLTIDSNEYVSSFITINKEKNPLIKGDNTFTIYLYPNPTDTNGKNIDPDNITDGNVLIMFNDIYSLNNRIWTENSTAFILNDNNSYIAKFDIIIAKNGIDYNKILGMVRTNGAIIENIYFNPELNNKVSDTYSCSNTSMDNLASRNDNYYIRTGADCNSIDNRIVAGTKWENQTLPKGVYSFAIKFKVTDANEVSFSYRAKEFNTASNSETRLKTTKLPVGIPFKNGLFLKVTLGSKVSDFFKSNETSQALMQAQTNTHLKVQAYNYSGNTLTNGTITVYSHTGSKSSFNSSSSGKGTILFSNNNLRQTILNSATILNNQSISAETTANAPIFNSNQYIVVVAKFDGNEFISFLDISILGKEINLASQFFSEVPNQIFDGSIFAKDGVGQPEILNLEINVYENCLRTIGNLRFSSSLNKDSLGVNGNYFAVEIPGTFTRRDCLDITINSKDIITNTAYTTLNRTLYAGAHNALDRGLGCVDVRTITGEDTSQILNWEEELKMVLENNCSFSVRANIESGLKCQLENSQLACNSTNGISLASGESINYTITGENDYYNPNITAPNFTDLLGFFQINIKAKRTSDARSRFVLADKFIVHLENNSQCFAISKDSFNLTEAQRELFVLTNHCQYNLINDYYIPKTQLNAFGYNLENPHALSNDDVNFNISLVVDGSQYNVVTTTTTESIYGEVLLQTAIDLESQLTDNNTAIYRVVFDLNNTKINEYSQTWTIDRPQIRVIDFNYGTSIHGAKIIGDINFVYENGTKVSLSPSSNFKINPFGCESGLTCEFGTNFGEGHAGEGAFEYALFYQTITAGKVDYVEINFEGNPNPANLEFTFRPRINYTITSQTLQPGTTPSSQATINLGNYSIQPFENVDYFISHINNIDGFNSLEFISRLNPNVQVRTNNNKVIAWVDRGILVARYIGESIDEFKDKTIENYIVKDFGSGIIYGRFTIIDYVSKDKAIIRGKEISGGNN